MPSLCTFFTSCRRLPSKLSTDTFLDILNQIAPGRYNFVYIPHDKTKPRNVALAFANFTDHETAKIAYSYFQGCTTPMDSRLGSHIRVFQADVQGLSQNLAYFIARSGLADMENPHAPRVFESGRQVNLLEAARKHVTMTLVSQAPRCAAWNCASLSVQGIWGYGVSRPILVCISGSMQIENVFTLRVPRRSST
ncbi:ML3 [Symbiodinium natans]|uniref:ML3 protein n=1 Tax=Symbiodinium natans TaxID=878477 RepID=A0A812P986_9DINO|nr:ML3 [Symbiodinium natans]